MERKENSSGPHTKKKKRITHASLDFENSCQYAFVNGDHAGTILSGVREELIFLCRDGGACPLDNIAGMERRIIPLLYGDLVLE